MRKLVQLSAFYKNDQSNGVRLTLTEEFGDLDLLFSSIRDSWDGMWLRAVRLENTESLVRSLREHLDEVGHSSEPIRTLITAYRVIGDIYLLERVGELKSDEYNGLLFAYRNV